MHGAGRYAAEVRVEISLTVLVVDLADEIVVYRVRLADDGRAFVRIVADEGVDLVAREIYVGLIVAHRGEEYVEIRDKVFREVVEPAFELFVGLVFRAQLRHDGRDRDAAYLAFKLVYLVLEVFFLLADETQLFESLLRDFLRGLLQLRLLLFGEFFELLLLHLAQHRLLRLRLFALRVAAVLRRDGRSHNQRQVDEALRRAFDGEVFRLGPLAQFVHYRVDFVLESLDEVRLAVLEFVVVEGLRQRRLQLLDGVGRVLRKLAPLAGRQVYRKRHARVVEVVYVDPVVRRGHRGGGALKLVHRVGGAPAAGLSHHEDVVSFALYG